ncbi:hypothetical protein MKEN_00186500 [Mycena kentingensis (nom. inval.)]|nr:hypothetical protein MKEN_00186500 [Mycena kentingensis (nom. inval.)]
MEDDDEASTTDVRSKAQISPRLTPCVNPPNSGNKVHGDAVHAGGGCIQREPEASALPHKIDVQRDLNTVVSDNARQYVVHFQHATDVTFGDHIQLQQKDQDSEDSIAVDQGYRTIPMGDIALLKEVTGFRSPAPRVSAYTGPRFYAARVRGCQTTVAVHHGGEEAKDCWRREVMDSARGLGHPNLVQIFAKSSFNCRYVVVYHGDLIPVHKLAHSKSGSSLVEFWLSWVWFTI